MLRDVAPGVGNEEWEKILSKTCVIGTCLSVLAGMRSLANWGERYRGEFERSIPSLATRFRRPALSVFLRKASPATRNWRSGRRTAPNRKGVERMVDLFVAFLRPILIAAFRAADRVDPGLSDLLAESECLAFSPGSRFLRRSLRN